MVVSKVKWWYPVPPCIIRVMDDHDSVLKMGQYMSNNTWHVKKDPLFRLKRLNALNGPQDVSIPYFVHLYPMFLGCFSCERGKGLPASLLGHLTNRIQPPPLEGLLFLACDWATCCWHVAHARLCSTGGSGCGGGPDNVLDDFKTGSTELVAFLDYALRREEKEMDEPVADCTRNMKSSTRRSKLTHCAGKTHIFELESHACQSKWISMLQTFLNKPHKYQLFAS